MNSNETQITKPELHDASHYGFQGELADAYNQAHTEGLIKAIELTSHLAAEETADWKYKAEHDALTGLMNTTAFKSYVEMQLDANQPIGLAFVDLDFFKRVNDELGHDEGDRLLAAFGLHLRTVFKRKTDNVEHTSLRNLDDKEPRSGRLGGDEFAVAFSIKGNNQRGFTIDEETGEKREQTEEERLMEGAALLIEAVNSFTINQPKRIRDLGFKASIGFAFSTSTNRKSVDELIRQADEMMYLKKRDGRDINVELTDGPSQRRPFMKWFVGKLLRAEPDVNNLYISRDLE